MRNRLTRLFNRLTRQRRLGNGNMCSGSFILIKERDGKGKLDRCELDFVECGLLERQIWVFQHQSLETTIGASSEVWGGITVKITLFFFCSCEAWS